MARATKTDKASGKGGSGKGRPKRTAPRNPPRKNARSARKKRGWFSRIADATVMTLRWTIRGLIAIAAAFVLLVALYAFVNPPTTPYIWSETRRLGTVDRQWVDLAEIEPVLARSVIAAEDANFCLHWGFDMEAIRDALEEGGARGASTITQQVVKNVFLWHGRSWARKALEAVMTPVVEALWSKRRIVEVYLNIAEFGEGVFGAEAAARTAFRVGPEALAPWQAARLAAILPDPKGRSASNPSRYVRNRARDIADGAATIQSDGRADCVEGVAQ